MGILEEECLLWDGYIDRDGYGCRNGYPRRKTGTNRVHRQTYIFAYGPIPDDMVVMHICDTPSCYRLSHLKIGTQGDNNKDSVKKGRSNNGRKGKVLRPNCSKCGGPKTWWGGKFCCAPCGRKYNRERKYNE